MRVALIAAMAALPLPGLAQDQAALPPGVVESCLADTPRGRVDPDCIGAAADQCQTAPGGSTTIGIGQCLSAETDAWDRLLNEEWKQVRSSFADDQTAADSLLAAQRAWIGWRDAECEFQYDRYGGGSMRSIAATGCRMTLTARRTFELRDMREW
ncbi:lysozyme inhibitor LprI family protein [uncultured Paracoccus sp.]|uniref:lysozyme inhibitor LprI family protein n=1 Tax=uncultured Paracoccus sp. TaxID=189685 RepID=UPI0025CDAA35|nr:lysozyme inhibitor LprI family protein [uncultured Paracoccus sp.]